MHLKNFIVNPKRPKRPKPKPKPQPKEKKPRHKKPGPDSPYEIAQETRVLVREVLKAVKQPSGGPTTQQINEWIATIDGVTQRLNAADQPTKGDT